MIRLDSVKYTLKHKVAILYLYVIHETGVPLLSVICHDLDKVFLYPILGKELTSKLHKKYSRHHRKRKDKYFAEAYLDYASARLTKLDKPKDALETFKQVAPHLYEDALEHYKKVKYK